MIDLVQKQKELVKSVQLLATQIQDLQKYKRELEAINIRLNRESITKLERLRWLSRQVLELGEQMVKIKQDMDDYRRQEFMNIAEEVEKRRNPG